MYTIATEEGRTDGCKFVSFITEKEVQKLLDALDNDECGSHVISRNNNWIFEVWITEGGFRALRKRRDPSSKMMYQDSCVLKAHYDNDSMFDAYSDYLADILPGIYGIKFLYFRKDYSSLNIILDCGVEFSFRVLTEDGQLTKFVKKSCYPNHANCDECPHDFRVKTKPDVVLCDNHEDCNSSCSTVKKTLSGEYTI